MQGDCQFSCNPLEPEKSICKHNSKCVSEIKQFLPKQIWTKEDRDEILIPLSNLFLFGSDCVNVCLQSVPFALEVVSRLTQSALSEGHSGQDLITKVAVAMSRGFPFSPEITRYAEKFIQLYKPFEGAGDWPYRGPFLGPPEEDDDDQISDLDWCRAIWSYIEYLPRNVWFHLEIGYPEFYFCSKNRLARWYAACTVCKSCSFKESETVSLLKRFFTSQEQLCFIIWIDEDVRAVRACLYKEGALGAPTTSLLLPERGDSFDSYIYRMRQTSLPHNLQLPLCVTTSEHLCTEKCIGKDLSTINTKFAQILTLEEP